MSDDIDRNQVLKNIKMHKTLKTDGFWIQASKHDKTTPEVKEKPPVPKKGYVLLKTKLFDDTANQTNQEVEPVKNDASPKETKANTSGDTKLQSPSEQIINESNTYAHVSTKDEKKVEVEAPAGKSNVEKDMEPIKVSADVKKEEQIQPALSANDNVEAAEPAPANKASAVKEENADTDPTSDLKVKAGVRNPAEVPDAPKEEGLVRAEPENTSSLEVKKENVDVQTTEGSQEKSPLQEPEEEIVFTATKFIVIDFAENTARPDEGISLQDGVESNVQEPVSKSPVKPGNETPAEGSCENHPQQQHDNQTVEAEVEFEMDTPDVDNATPTKESPPPQSVQQVTYTLPDSNAAEDAATEEPVVQNKTNEIVKNDIPTVENPAVEQNAEPSFEDVVDPMDLNIEDALKPIPAANAEAIQDSSDDKPIDLEDALLVKEPKEKSAPKTEEQEQRHKEEPNQKPDDTKISEGIQKPKQEINTTQVFDQYWKGSQICSRCNKVFGNIRIIFSEPPMRLHPECLKCGVCSAALGDLLTTMFLHDNVVHCGDCFRRASNI